jgi:hypothetical protein
MKLNLLKGFAAVAMLCMVGAVLAEPVAVSGISKLSDGKIGAYTQKLYDEGKISKDEYYRLMGKIKAIELSGVAGTVLGPPVIVVNPVIGGIVTLTGISLLGSAWAMSM